MLPWWMVSVVACGALVMVGTTGIGALALRFVHELSRPGVPLDARASTWTGWQVALAVPEPPKERQRPLAFQAPGGPLLAGEFWAQAHPAPTIIICHGYRGDSSLLRPVAAQEYQHGYNTLLFDFRGHGHSAPAAISGGHAEVHDLLAALAVAHQQPETLPQALFIHGFSIGAAVALLASAHGEVLGIIADSPYARLDRILCQFVLWQLMTQSDAWGRPWRWLRLGFPALARATFIVSDLIFRMCYRQGLRARPERSIGQQRGRLGAPPGPAKARKAGAQQQNWPTPILLLHARYDPYIPLQHAQRIVRAAQAGQVPLEVHVVESASHCGAYEHNPQHYIALVQRFITRLLQQEDALDASRLV